MAALAAFILWQLVSLAWAPNLGYGARDVSLWFATAVLLAAGWRLLTGRAVEWFQYSLAALCLILSITQIIWFVGGDLYPFVFFNYGITAEMLAAALPLQVAACLSSERRWLAVVSGLSAGLSWLALIETLRRGPLLGCLLGFLVLGAALLLRIIKLSHWRMLAGLCGAFVLVSLLHFGGPLAPRGAAAHEGGSLIELKSRVLDLFSGVRQSASPAAPANSNAAAVNTAAPPATVEASSSQMRLRYWGVGLEMVKRHPLVGVGVGGYVGRYAAYRKDYLDTFPGLRSSLVDENSDLRESCNFAHNEYLQILAETGAVGLALFLLWAASVGWLLWQRRKENQYLLLGAPAGLTAFAVSSLVSSFSFRQMPTTTIAVCLIVLGTARAGVKEAAGGDEERVIRLPRAAVAVVLCAALALSAVFTWRAYGEMESTRLQAEPDLKFSPNEPAKNEAWLAQYRQALQYNPYNFGAQFGCGMLLFQMKRPQEALPHLEAARRLGYNRPFSNLLLAFAYEQTKQADKGAKLLAETLDSFPESLAVRTAYIEFLRQTGDTEGMRREFAILKRQNETLAKSETLIMRMKPTAALEEARKQNLPPPYDYFKEPVEFAAFQMRSFLYLP